MRNLILVLGDQLDRHSAAFDDFDPATDAVWMAEVEEETTHVWAHKLRIAVFFAAMRHFRDELRERGWTVYYTELTARQSDDRGQNFAEVLSKDVHHLQPERLIIVQPGDWRVQQMLTQAAEKLNLPLEIREDRHFYCTLEEFKSWAGGKKKLVLENFYRQMRLKHDVLIDPQGEPVGGAWNFDADNRETFSSRGPQGVKNPHRFQTDEITQGVLDLVAERFADHPGRLDHFVLPVTHSQARIMLRDFINQSLDLFGPYEDALWTDEAFLFHSRLSVVLNLKLLSPRECVDAAVKAYHDGKARLNSVEGFVRQILGWREYVRGIYWMHMPDYAEMNHLDQPDDVPQFFWDGQTDMECVRQSMNHVLDHGYAHHIHRLMIMGNLAQISGVDPRKFHQWHMAMYLDAIDWVSLPNALGMSQYGDGGIMATKPYCASGNYINKMSNFCKNCRYDYRQSTGDNACPFTTFYWDFLDRHAERFRKNMRMKLQVKNVDNKREKKAQELQAIRARAAALRKQWQQHDAAEPTAPPS